MAKFSIECPNCGNFAQASTGFFSKKKIDCSCGYVINVKTDKLSSCTCSHCGNQVVVDQSKGESAVCPVCKEPVNTVGDKQKYEEFSCAQCGVRLQTARGASTYVCPVCDCVNDVNERLMQEKIRKDGLASIIKYEGDNNTLIWKHPIEDFNYGSQLIVHESQEAIFFKDGQALDLFGPGRHTLVTQQLPLLEKLYKLPTDTQGTFHSEVYFINKTVQMDLKWGTPEKVRFIDPLTGTPLEIGASGSMNIQVSDSRKLLLKLVGTMKGISWDDKEGFTKSLQASFRPMVANAVKVNLASVIKSQEIDILEIDEKLDLISNTLLEKINPGFEEYGFNAPQFYVNNVVLPEDDPNFKRIRELHTITLQAREIQAKTTIRTAEEQSRATIETAKRAADLEVETTKTEVFRREQERKIIEAQAEAEAMKYTGFAEAQVMQAKGYNQKDVMQTEVQKAYAEGLGHMGANGGGGGSSIMGDMVGLGVGLTAASAIAPQFSNMMQGMTQMNQPAAPMAPAAPAPAADSWNCSCGQTGIVGNFCNNCGSPKPAPVAAPMGAWDCSCGQKGIIGNFCNNCGARKPEAPATWNCSCGQTGIVGNFCNNCGAKRGN